MLLRAAAVADLRLTGLLDMTGAAAPAPDGLDPFLAEVLGTVPAGQRRDWFELIVTRSRKAEDAVRDGLATAGVITVERHRVLGLFPARRIGLVDAELVESLRVGVRQAVLEDSAPIEQAMLAVLAIDGNIGTVFGWRDLRGRSATVRALRDRVDYELPGLWKSAEAAIAVERSPVTIPLHHDPGRSERSRSRW